jgi:hypothetical protein
LLAGVKLQEANGELKLMQPLADLNQEITIPLAMTMLTKSGKRAYTRPTQAQMVHEELSACQRS